MTLDGASNSTFDQMRNALQLDGLSQADINSGYRSLIALLTSLDPSVTMRIANSIWYRQTFRVNQSFLDDLRTYFDADAEGLNFSDVNGSLATINGWVNQKTNGKIPTILDNITSDNVMFLINALYFDGSWREQFDAAKTTDDVFTTAPGVTQRMRLMHREGDMSYTETPTYQAVDLPYGNTAFTMTVLLPKAGVNVETVAEGLTNATWSLLTASFATAEVDLALPKFQMSFQRVLNDDLSALGMGEAFIAGHADFTRMSPDGLGLYISFVTQKTFVDVDERGTKAAAATTVGVSVTSMPAYRVMRIDRPFVFVIRERLSGTVLFMGKVVRIAS
jgi:serpin B